jgi:hypothetical protein
MRNEARHARAAHRWSFALAIGALAVSGCSDSTGPATGGFRGSYAMGNWVASSIFGGTTAITPAAGETDTAKFSYTVNLGNPASGVSFRTATYSTTAAASGPVQFDWRYTGYHAFFQVDGTFEVFAATSATDTTFVGEVNQDVGGQSFSLTGSATIQVVAGQKFGVIIGGSNSDSDSRLIGTLAVFNFKAPT